MKKEELVEKFLDRVRSKVEKLTVKELRQLMKRHEVSKWK